MKGYGILMLVVSLLLCIMPTVIVSPSEKAVQGNPQSLTVRHSDGEGESTISLYDMTLYETASKMPTDAPDEAIKAQFVADYTLLCYQQETTGRITSTAMTFPSSYTAEFWQQTWGESFQKQDTRLRGLLDEVYGKCIVYQGQPIMAVSHAMNSGQTENGSLIFGEAVPYLSSVASPADALCPNRLTTVTISREDMVKHIQTLTGRAANDDVGVWFGNVTKSPAGTVITINLNGVELSGNEVASALGLPSSAFEVTIENDQVVFTVLGSGHFIGMSVNGAISMANDGQQFDNILKYYYSGVTIV